MLSESIVPGATPGMAARPAAAFARTSPDQNLTTSGNTDVLVAYERVGGIVGMNDRIVVKHDGGAIVSTPRTTDFTLSTAEYRALRDVLDRITTTWSSTDGREIPGQVTYAIGYRDWQAVHCHRPPDDWRPAVARLDALIGRSAW